MHVESYIMLDQARDKIRDIMRERDRPELLSWPSWLALLLVIAGCNLLAVASV